MAIDAEQFVSLTFSLPCTTQMMVWVQLQPHTSAELCVPGRLHGFSSRGWLGRLKWKINKHVNRRKHYDIEIHSVKATFPSLNVVLENGFGPVRCKRWERLETLKTQLGLEREGILLETLKNVSIDWPSCPKVMMYCHFSLLIWAVLAIICTWSLPNRAIFCIPPLTCHNTTDWLTHINFLLKKERNQQLNF